MSELEQTEKLDESPLIEVAMQIILHAGDARSFATDALEAAKKGDFVTADDLIVRADAQVLEAHKTQTEVIQGAMSGTDYGYSLLFAHAQDTFMTIMSEIRLTKQIVDVLRIIYAQR